MKVPRTPPSFDRLMEQPLRPQLVLGARPVDRNGRYLHWDDMLRRTPPDGMTHEDWWLSTTVARIAAARHLPMRATDGTPFRFSNVDRIQEMVHMIDQQASGQIIADGIVTNLRSSDRYLVSSLVEEAITSSQLEGASTTRRVAKELLATGRKPRDRSEQMIVNNYQAMLYAQEMANEPLSPTSVLDLHRIVCENAIDNPQDAGRLQTPEDERIAVYWDETDILLHTPPPADVLSDRLEAMCRFANGEPVDGFIHPVLRAIVVHFWLAYDHPFVDGNGRTARALFYWSMLRNGYWLTQYLSVSSILRKAPAKYARSYLLTQTDSNDLTYFLIYQLEVIEQAIQSLHQYLARKISETQEIEAMLHGSPHLNHRQLVVLHDALRDPGESFTIAAQSRRHRVTYQSARTDLLALEEMGLMSKQRAGKKFVFRAVPNLEEKLRQLGSSA